MTGHTARRNATVARLRAEVAEQNEALVAYLGKTLRLEAELAAANALLVRVRDDWNRSTLWIKDIRAHLTEQPAAPVRCVTHDAPLANVAFFKCGCRHCEPAPPEPVRVYGGEGMPDVTLEPTPAPIDGSRK